MYRRDGESNPKIVQRSAALFSSVLTLCLRRCSENSAWNVAFDRYASIGTVMHYILAKSWPLRNLDLILYWQPMTVG